MKKTYPNFLLLLAIIGAFILYFTFGSNKYGPFSSKRLTPYGTDNYNWEYLLIIILGTCLILPYIIYILRKNPSKKELKEERLGLNKIGHTIESYFRFKAKKGIVEVYVQNQTGEKLIINRNSILENEKWHVFKIKKYNSLHFNNGITLNVDKELNVEVIDNRNQVSFLGDDFIMSNGIPEYVNHAFILGKPNEGDG